MSSIYLASRYADRERMLRVAAELRRRGHVVTSRWINGGHEITQDADNDAERRRFAYEDLTDVLLADTLVYFSDPEFHGTGRGGRHVEFGVAIRSGLRVYLVGARENVFHWLSEVTVVADIETLYDSVGVGGTQQEG